MNWADEVENEEDALPDAPFPVIPDKDSAPPPRARKPVPQAWSRPPMSSSTTPAPSTHPAPPSSSSSTSTAMHSLRSRTTSQGTLESQGSQSSHKHKPQRQAWSTTPSTDKSESGKGADRWKSYAEKMQKEYPLPHQKVVQRGFQSDQYPAQQQQPQQQQQQRGWSRGLDEESGGGSWRSVNKPPQRTSSSHTGREMQRRDSSREKRSRMSAVVTSLKDKFGFMQVVSEPHSGDVFFHFDEAAKSTDPAALRVGDEVEMDLVVGRDNRLSASRLKLLDRGSIRLDETVESKTGLYGVVITETFRPPLKRSGSSSLYNSKGPGATLNTAELGRFAEFFEAKTNTRYWVGRIMLLSQKELEQLEQVVPGDVQAAVPDGERIFCFTARGISRNEDQPASSPKDDAETASLSGKTDAGSVSSKSSRVTRSRKARSHFPVRGDIVKFDAARELATGRVHAVNIQVVKSIQARSKDIIENSIKKQSLKRERGRIANLSVPVGVWNSGASGTIECEDRSDKVFFSYRDLPDKFKPNKQDANKDTAPKKTGWRQSVVTGSGSPSSNAIHPGVEFEFYSVQDPLHPDRLIAWDMKELEPGSVVFEHLVLAKVKALVVNTFRQPRKNAPPSEQGERPFARVRLLENHMELAGLKLPSGATIPPSATKEENGGHQENQQEESNNVDTKETSVELEFFAQDMVMPAPKPRQNDVVFLDIFKVKRTNVIVPRGVQLCEPFDEKDRLAMSPIDVWKGKSVRETGVVNKVLDTFGFIDCLDRPGQVFFPLKEVIAYRHVEGMPSMESSGKDLKPRRSIKEELLREGDAVSFQVEADSLHNSSVSGGRSTSSGGSSRSLQNVAIRVLKLADSPADIVLQEKLVGFITKAPQLHGRPDSRRPGRRGRSNNPSSADVGTLKCQPSTFVAPELYEALDKFTRDQLLLDDGNKAVQLELLPDPRYFRKSSKGSSSNRKPTTSSSKEGMYRLIVPSNYESVVREYCSWFGLRADFRTGEESREATILIKKRPLQGKLSRNSKKQSQHNATSQEDNTKSQEDGAEHPSEQQKEKDEDGEDGNVEEDVAEQETKQSQANVMASFNVASVLERRPLNIGDKVEFTLCLDRKTMRHVAHSITVLESNLKKPGPVKRRPDTEVGVVATIHNQGYGHIQPADGSERVFFLVSECEGAYRSSVEPGDEVEFRRQESKKGPRASGIRFLPKGTIILDDPVLNPETGEQEKFTGEVIREPTRISEIRTIWRDDHPSAKKIALLHVASHMLGRVVDSASASQGTNSTRNKNSKAKSEESYEKPDWRRANELHKMVDRFSKSEDKLWEVDNTLPRGELKEIEKSARQMKLAFGWLKDSLIIAKSREAVKSFKEEKKKEESSRGAEDRRDVGQEGNEEEEEEEVASQEQLERGEGEKQPSSAADAKDEGGEEEENTATTQGASETEGSRAPATLRYNFSLSDVLQPKDKDVTPFSDQAWVPLTGDLVEFVLCRNRTSKKVRATNIRLINSASVVCRGVIEGAMSDRFGFVRPLVAGMGVTGDGRDVVDEAFRPGAGGRDGSLRFDRSQVLDNVVLRDGDEVEYTLVTDRRTKEAKATRVRFICRAQVEEIPFTGAPPQLNRDALKKLSGASSAVAMQRFSMAKGPDGTNGFPAGRGRNLPLRTKLRVTAKEFKPSF